MINEHDRNINKLPSCAAKHWEIFLKCAQNARIEDKSQQMAAEN